MFQVSLGIHSDTLSQKKKKKSQNKKARHWRLRLVILATWEAEIRRI
jgi:hypothetical protein